MAVVLTGPTTELYPTLPYMVSLLRLSWILATVSHSVLHYARWANRLICAILYIGQNPQSLAQLPMAQSTSILSIWTKDWNFLGHWLIPVFEVPIHWQGYVPSFQFNHLPLHSYFTSAQVTAARLSFDSAKWLLYIGHLYKWADLSGTKSGTHERFHCIWDAVKEWNIGKLVILQT
jgi:hypothetical protein